MFKRLKKYIIKSIKDAIIEELLKDSIYKDIDLVQLHKSAGKKPDIFFCILKYPIKSISLDLEYIDSDGISFKETLNYKNISEFMSNIKKYKVPSDAAQLLTCHLHYHYHYHNRDDQLSAKYFTNLSGGVFSVNDVQRSIDYILEWYDKHPELKLV